MCPHCSLPGKRRDSSLKTRKTARDHVRPPDKIERSRKRLAKCLNLLEAVTGNLEFVFEQNPDWNSEIKYQIEEASVKLGFSLATLTNWFDDEPEKE